MSKKLDTACSNQKELTLNECFERLETLFKAYQKDSEFNYQLTCFGSPFNKLYMLKYIFEKYNITNIEELNKRLKEKEKLEKIIDYLKEICIFKYKTLPEEGNNNLMMIISKKDGFEFLFGPYIPDETFDLLKEVLK